MRYTRSELTHILAARHLVKEGQGDNAFLEFRIKVTPELLEKMIGGYWINANGGRVRFDGVYVGADGYVEPILVMEETP